MLKITRFLIDRPLITRIILSFFLISAVVSVFKLQRQAYPRVDYQQMRITTIYPGASPEDVELNVTVKLEEALKELEGIEKYVSDSLENLSIITVFIDPNAEDKEKIKSEIRRVIDTVTDLPEEVEKRPNIEEEKVDNMPIYEIALSMQNGNESTLNYHIKRLKKKLLELNTVSRVNESGVQDKEIKILLNKDKMKKKAVTFYEVIQAIKKTKLRVSGGTIESYTLEKGIVTFSEFSKPGDIENIIIRSGGIGGNKIRIKDVGRVEEGFEKEHVINKYNGKVGLSLWVLKKSTVDVIKTVNDIKKVIEDYKKMNSDEGLEFFSTWDASIETKNRLFIVYTNAILGFIFVLIILFLFLDKKVAVWTAVGIPFSIAGTIILLPFFNVTINSVSLLGFVVVLGMLVDDAIIISESIYSARENGMPPIEASIFGLKSVVKPVIATIVTTIIAFLPLYFLPGLTGDFALEIPTVVIIMLTISLLEAIFMLPAHLAHIKERDINKYSIPVGQRFLNWLGYKYEKILVNALRHRYRSLLFLILFLVIGGVVTIFITRFTLYPLDQAYDIWISGETPRGNNLEYTLKETKKIEAIIDDLPKDIVYSYKTHAGSKYNTLFTGEIYSSNYFYIKLTLIPATKRKMSAEEVRDNIKSEIAKRKIDVFSALDFFIDSGGPPLGKPLEIMISGNDNEKREELINRIINDLKNFPVTDIDTNLKKGKEELRILPKYDKLAEAQLDVSSIAQTIRTAFDGEIVAHFQTPEEEIPFRVMLDEESKSFIDPLNGLYVRNGYGSLVSIKNFIYQTEYTAPQTIYHYNGERTNMITANLDREKTTAKKIYDELSKRYKNIEKEYYGFKIRLGGEAEESFKTFFNLLILLIIAILAIYFLLVMQFNSFTQPIMMILSIPFGLFGITIAFGLQFTDLSMLAMVGVIGFTGVVVNDSLIMVHFINDKRKNGKDKNNFINTIIEGAKLRLRPIVMTTLTTVVALFPTAYGIIGGIDSFVSPMVMAMMWGLMVGTIATLIVIPVLYLINEDIRGVFKKKNKNKKK